MNCIWKGTLVGVSPSARNCQKTGTTDIRVIEFGTIQYGQMCRSHARRYEKLNRTMLLV